MRVGTGVVCSDAVTVDGLISWCCGDFGFGTNTSEDLEYLDPLSPALMDSLKCSMVASV